MGIGQADLILLIREKEIHHLRRTGQDHIKYPGGKGWWDISSRGDIPL